jgi:hypothetical protein
MSEERTKRIVKLLILSWAFVMLLIAALAFLLFLAFRDTNNSLQRANHQIAELRAIQPIAGRDGLSIVGPAGPAGQDGRDGRDGKDSVSTVTIIQEAVPGPIGPQGLPGITPRVPIFDGMGHYKYPDDDEWLPLFQEAE